MITLIRIRIKQKRIMRTIDINELRLKYDMEVSDAYDRTLQMINERDCTNSNLEDAYGTTIDWAKNNQNQMGVFDSFIDKSIDTNIHNEVIIAHKTDDEDMLDIAKQDLKQCNGKRYRKKNKNRQKQIRKIMRDDAMKQLSLSYPFSDLSNDEVIKEIWINCKADVRNNINDLMESINLLSEIERYIQLSNNYNECK